MISIMIFYRGDLIVLGFLCFIVKEYDILVRLVKRNIIILVNFVSICNYNMINVNYYRNLELN